MVYALPFFLTLLYSLRSAHEISFCAKVQALLPHLDHNKLVTASFNKSEIHSVSSTACWAVGTQGGIICSPDP